MRVVYEAAHLIDAHLVRGALEQAGIPAFVRGEHLTGAMGELPVAGLVAVCVPESALERARGIVAEVDAALREAQAAAAEDGGRTLDDGVLQA
ncbi:DUF2007 domain-containing protein [Coralloluteibacterium stylophorae]|uniref:DUF2007 domain-containing protein n=1 Tax=Coralloluteibacterium stylophorae TaxID=1776034 RepID=A0A8J8AZ57_9GAMM|nr:DUF2007 domain-containing protein [Coralloluteibacterium stylophorae]MBS7456131.1 DUF2007 domain-containing protein [Coralloluteibacterium stylophorae]